MARKKILVLLGLILLLALSLAACDDSEGCPDCDAPDGDETDGDETDGDDPDGDAPDGDETDGDAPDGDEACDDCDFLVGHWCVQNPQGSACDQLAVASVSVSEVVGSPCMFAAAVHFSNGMMPVFFYFQGCTIDALPIMGGVCLLTIDPETSTVSVDCPGLCSFTLSQQGCEPGCLCDEENACCDGCNPINEGDTCDDGNACTTGDRCQSGACVPTALKDCSEYDDACNEGVCVEGDCEARPRDDQTPCDDGDLCTVEDVCIDGVCTGTPLSCVAQHGCHEDGVCNPETGLCVHAPKPNGIACDGLGDGTPRSGVCRHGNCLALDACMMRVYDQPLGHTCNFNEDCESGLCSRQLTAGVNKIGREVPSACTRPCDPENDDCPNGLTCMETLGWNKTENNNLLHLCLPVTVPPPYETRGILEPCTIDANCESDLCIYDDYGLSYCTQDCHGEQGPDDTLCGDCGVCRPWYNKGDNKLPGYICMAPPRQYQGGFCTSHLDCEDQFCYDNTCVSWCGGRPKSNSGQCPAGFSCVHVDDYIGDLCIPKRDIRVADENEICTQQHACADGLYCDMPQAWGAIAVLYTGDLWEHLAGDAFFRGIGGYEEHYSYFTHTATYTGSYLLEISPWWTSGSTYALTATTGPEPTQTIQRHGPTDWPANAMPLELPIRVQGSFWHYERHWYRFDLEAGQTLTVALGPVADFGVCKPKKDHGEACLFGAECAGGVCFMDHCTEPCSYERDGDDPCPSGSTCSWMSHGKGDAETKGTRWPQICLPDDKIDLDIGETCDYWWQCESGDCFANLCVQRCDTEGNGPLRNGEGDCPTGYTCTGLRWWYSDLCLPEETVNKDFGESCMFDYECESALCYSGACNIPCWGMEEDCPEDHSCVQADYGQYTCIPSDQLDREFGEPCRFDANCESDLCIDKSCNIPCEVEPIRPLLPMCPEDFVCITHQLGGNYDAACLPEDRLDKGFGEACRRDYECESQFCHFGKCNVACDDYYRSSDSCPTDYTCRPGYFSGDWVCSPDSL